MLTRVCFIDVVFGDYNMLANQVYLKIVCYQNTPFAVLFCSQSKPQEAVFIMQYCTKSCL